MIISIDGKKKKKIWPNSTSIHDKNSHQIWYRRNIRKTIYDKPTVNIIFNNKKLKAFPLKSGARQGSALLSFLFNIVLGVLDTAIRQGKEIKGIQIVRKEVKLSLFANGIILHIKNVKVSTKKNY